MENRLVDFICEMNEKGINKLSDITKQLGVRFGSKFRVNLVESKYLTDYLNGKLNFNTKIIELKRV